MSPNQFFIFHDSIHFFISLIIGLLLSKIYKNRLIIFVSIFVGIFIDADHLVDLFLVYLNKFGLPIKVDKLISLFYSPYMKEAGKIFVPLHSIDLLWVWWLIGRRLNPVFKVKGIEWAVSLSIITHILIDYASYSPNPMAYFLLFRVINNFGR